VLDRFDFVIGSIHSRFGMSEAEMTRRVLTAMDDPHLAILGHPTGRLLLQREPYAIDLEQVLAKAAARGIAVEVNADPHRLDLDWRMVRRARELGVTLSIGADAHSTSGMSNVAVGLGIARKGWLEPDQVLNARDADAFLAFARARLVAAG
jgi:DNA polymerase (family 10)